MKSVLIMIAALVLAACSDDCRNTPHQTVISPDGRIRAILFDRECGATTGFTTQVSLTGADAPSGKGNVFIADHGARAAAWGGPWAEVSWIGPKKLLVRYDATARVFAQNKTFGDVRVRFEPTRR